MLPIIITGYWHVDLCRPELWTNTGIWGQIGHCLSYKNLLFHTKTKICQATTNTHFNKNSKTTI